jgi:hypothetical protein
MEVFVGYRILLEIVAKTVPGWSNAIPIITGVKVEDHTLLTP